MPGRLPSAGLALMLRLGPSERPASTKRAPPALSRHFAAHAASNELPPADESRLKTGRSTTGTILAHSPSETTPQELVSRIQPHRHVYGTRYKTPIAVVLLSKSFAPWLLDDNTIVKPALERLFSKTLNVSSEDLTFHAIVAAVDRLPAPSYTSPAYQAGKLILDDTGHEGLAFLVSDAALTALDALQHAPAGGAAVHQDVGSAHVGSQHPATLSLVLRPSTTYLSKRTATDVYRSYTLQFPIANTIFQNGQPSTMRKSTWRMVAGSSELQKVVALGTRDLEEHHQTITYPISVLETGNRGLTPAIPLVALTAPRRIEAGMGNIIRQLSFPFARTQKDRQQGASSDNGLGVMPASQELEKAVDGYFQAKAVAPHAMTVWALVVPQELMENPVSEARHYAAEFGIQSSLVSSSSMLGEKDVNDHVTSQDRRRDAVPKNEQREEAKVNLKDIWTSEPSARSSRTLWTLLRSGARLHRVLSGGGGWGKKAGLLSLDPDSSYDSLQSGPSPSDPFGFGSLLEEDEKDALGEVARVGDWVQFLISPQDRNGSPLESQVPGGDNSSTPVDTGATENQETRDILQSADFGTIPSTIDALPTAFASPGNGSQESRFTVYDSHFGLLSEGGMSVAVNYHLMPEEQLSGRGQQTKTADSPSKTKIDVPHTRFTLQIKEPYKNMQHSEAQKSGAVARFGETVEGGNQEKSEGRIGSVLTHETGPKLINPGTPKQPVDRPEKPKGSDRAVTRNAEGNDGGLPSTQGTAAVGTDQSAQAIEHAWSSQARDNEAADPDYDPSLKQMLHRRKEQRNEEPVAGLLDDRWLDEVGPPDATNVGPSKGTPLERKITRAAAIQATSFTATSPRPVKTQRAHKREVEEVGREFERGGQPQDLGRVHEAAELRRAEQALNNAQAKVERLRRQQSLDSGEPPTRIRTVETDRPLLTHRVLPQQKQKRPLAQTALQLDPPIPATVSRAAERLSDRPVENVGERRPLIRTVKVDAPFQVPPQRERGAPLAQTEQPLRLRDTAIPDTISSTPALVPTNAVDTPVGSFDIRLSPQRSRRVRGMRIIRYLATTPEAVPPTPDSGSQAPATSLGEARRPRIRTMRIRTIRVRRERKGLRRLIKHQFGDHLRPLRNHEVSARIHPKAHKLPVTPTPGVSFRRSEKPLVWKYRVGDNGTTRLPSAPPSQSSQRQPETDAQIRQRYLLDSSRSRQRGPKRLTVLPSADRTAAEHQEEQQRQTIIVDARDRATQAWGFLARQARGREQRERSEQNPGKASIRKVDSENRQARQRASELVESVEALLKGF
ncbi:hypothetical protein B0A49_07042 [Cryomyces minteri]|uniref:Uncharacterized protein n=1 Tax=Cryomyces minteri TaxID=331657 RepID=A0A4U0X6I4_9PEZI|nr:hypothetical protein B0A49_07042 [Cryomyces minteri]